MIISRVLRRSKISKPLEDFVLRRVFQKNTLLAVKEIERRNRADIVGDVRADDVIVVVARKFDTLKSKKVKNI